jgi:hypothetical protein
MDGGERPMSLPTREPTHFEKRLSIVTRKGKEKGEQEKGNEGKYRKGKRKGKKRSW